MESGAAMELRRQERKKLRSSEFWPRMNADLHESAKEEVSSYPTLPASICVHPRLVNLRPAAAFMRPARRVEHQLRSIAVLKHRRALDRRLTRAQSFDDPARERRKTARPATVAHSRRQFAAINFNSLAFTCADF